jgi:hypothetical protein
VLDYDVSVEHLRVVARSALVRSVFVVDELVHGVRRRLSVAGRHVVGAQSQLGRVGFLRIVTRCCACVGV